MIPAEAVEAAANQLRSQLNDFTTPDILMRKRARMVLIAAAPYLRAAAERGGGKLAEAPKDAVMVAVPGTEWGTDHWGDIMSEPTEGHARGVCRITGAKLYRRSPMGQWEEVAAERGGE